MIQIDRDSSTPVHEQLAEQIRYLIVSGRYEVGMVLPSTRVLGEQVNVSFHTVRKAYQLLEQGGLLDARIGSGYRVKERAPLGKSERIERGAAIVQEALHRLIGLGLHESEIEYLVQEQLETLAAEHEHHKILFAAPYLELAEIVSGTLSHILQRYVEPTEIEGLARHQDADYVLARFADVQFAQETLPHADVHGVVVYLRPDTLQAVAVLLPHETLGLVTRQASSIGPLSAELRAQSGFSGQLLAAPVETDAPQLARLAEQTDLLVYTPACRRRLLPVLNLVRRHTPLHIVVSPESLDNLRERLPG